MLSPNTKTILLFSFSLLFIPLLIIRIWFDISQLQNFRPLKLLLPSAFLLIVFFRTKVTWLFALSLFAYGIYYYFFVAVRIAYPGEFEFTLPINELLYGDKTGIRNSHSFQRYLTLFPLTFSAVAAIAFFTIPVRKLYWTKSLKVSKNGC